MNLTEQEIEKAEQVQTEDEWNAFCDGIKAARNGQYPPDWWGKMRASGRMERIFNRFGGTTEIKLGKFKFK